MSQQVRAAHTNDGRFLGGRGSRHGPHGHAIGLNLLPGGRPLAAVPAHGAVGALERHWFGAYVAELCGIDLSGAPQTQPAVGGAVVDARMAEVNLLVRDDEDSYAWSAPVWFCEPWRPAFGLLGLTGFFDHFEATIALYEEWIELTPINQ